MSGGKKFDENKVPMELLSHKALEEIAKVFGVGAVKYGRFNYKAGIAWTRIIGAAYRHLGAFNSGEDLDPESGLSHIAHLGCCVIMLLDYIRTHKELDDRHKEPKDATESKEVSKEGMGSERSVHHKIREELETLRRHGLRHASYTDQGGDES